MANTTLRPHSLRPRAPASPVKGRAGCTHDPAHCWSTCLLQDRATGEHAARPPSSRRAASLVMRCIRARRTQRPKPPNLAHAASVATVGFCNLTQLELTSYVTHNPCRAHDVDTHTDTTAAFMCCWKRDDNQICGGKLISTFDGNKVSVCCFYYYLLHLFSGYYIF